MIENGEHIFRTGGGVVAVKDKDIDMAARIFILECIGDSFLDVPLDAYSMGFDGWIMPTEERNERYEAWMKEVKRRNLEYSKLSFFKKMLLKLSK